MIEQNELRVGNRFEINGKEIFIDLRLLHAITHRFKGYCLEDINPIPLTNEWVSKFGFTGFGELELDIDWMIFLFKNGDLYIDVNEGSYSPRRLSHIDSVHKFQNLFFALTGEELIFNV